MCSAGDYAFNLHPDITTLGGAYLDLVEAYGWKSVTILYQDNDSMMTLKQIFDRTSTVEPGDEFRLGKYVTIVHGKISIFFLSSYQAIGREREWVSRCSEGGADVRV